MTDLSLLIATAAEGEEEGGSFLVSPDIGLMIWTLIVFGLSLYLLNKLAFPRIAEALDRRQKAIEESIDTAAKIRRRPSRSWPSTASGSPRRAVRPTRSSPARARPARRPRARSSPTPAPSARR
jgi:hypothetical protein